MPRSQRFCVSTVIEASGSRCNKTNEQREKPGSVKQSRHDRQYLRGPQLLAWERLRRAVVLTNLRRLLRGRSGWGNCERGRNQRGGHPA